VRELRLQVCRRSMALAAATISPRLAMFHRSLVMNRPAPRTGSCYSLWPPPIPRPLLRQFERSSPQAHGLAFIGRPAPTGRYHLKLQLDYPAVQMRGRQYEYCWLLQLCHYHERKRAAARAANLGSGIPGRGLHQIPACAANAPGCSLGFWRRSGDRAKGGGGVS
jgi:hypothetical protein